MAALEFNDGVLTELRPVMDAAGFGQRFRNWVPDSKPEGVDEPALADDEIHRWNYREDHLASFELPYLTASQLAIAGRLKIHAMNGGLVTVKTDDTAARVYTVKLKSKTEPEIRADPQKRGRFVFAMVVRNTVAVPMRCTYSGPSA